MDGSPYMGTDSIGWVDDESTGGLVAVMTRSAVGTRRENPPCVTFSQPT